MSSEMSKNEFNKEYVCVRRLISVLTNDDSDKPIVEKLKGKNLSVLLYNAKIINNSKNIAANKRILGCVIRAIEKEKHLCKKRALDFSWGRKLLLSFNCLNPIKTFEEFSVCSSLSRGCTIHTNKVDRKHKLLLDSSIRQQKQSTKAIKFKNVVEKRIDYSSKSEMKAGTEKDRCVVQNDEISRNYSAGESVFVLCTIMQQRKTYESISPANLTDLKYVEFVYNNTKKTPTKSHIVEKTSSSTQTFEVSAVKNCETVPNNIKLQDLLEAATSLISTHDQREYAKSFLSNFEPPFNLSEGFPPYLKLPMKPSDEHDSKESVYGSNSEISVPSVSFLLSTGDNVRQRENRVKDYVHNLSCDPWQETAESIISGVINESLPHERGDYSQLGACILKRLGAYPSDGFRNQKINIHNTIVPELVLSCTEWFESDTCDQEKSLNTAEISLTRKKSVLSKPNEMTSNESTIEYKLIRGPTDHSRTWNEQRVQNYCFYDPGSEPQMDLLDLSDGSICGMNTGEEVHGVVSNLRCQPHDRNHFRFCEPLKISPSVLEQGMNSGKRDSLAEQTRSSYSFETENNCRQAEGNSTFARKPGSKVGKCLANSVHKVTANGSDSRSLIVIDSKVPDIDSPEPQSISATVANVSMFQLDVVEAQGEEEPEVTTYISAPGAKDEPTVMESEQPTWEVETYDGLGECRSKASPTNGKLSTDKTLFGKNRDRSSLRDKLRGKKKCKTNPRNTKKSSDKDEVDLSRTCKVM